MRVAGNAALLRETLKRVRGTIEDLDLRGKQDVLSALAVEVRVAGYEPCAACGGSGYQPVPPDSGRRWPPACDHCQRMRVLPVVEVRLTAPEALLQSSPTAGQRSPVPAAPFQFAASSVDIGYSNPRTREGFGRRKPNPLSRQVRQRAPRAASELVICQSTAPSQLR